MAMKRSTVVVLALPVAVGLTLGAWIYWPQAGLPDRYDEATVKVQGLH
ncbi:MAG: hypothetical protein AAF581_19775 [Planctomycetota bacterium]